MTEFSAPAEVDTLDWSVKISFRGWACSYLCRYYIYQDIYIHLLLAAAPLGSGRMLEHDVDEEAEVVEPARRGHVDVVEGVPVRLEGALPDAEQEHVGEHEGDQDHQEQHQEAVGVLVVTKEDSR